MTYPAIPDKMWKVSEEGTCPGCSLISMNAFTHSRVCLHIHMNTHLYFGAIHDARINLKDIQNTGHLGTMTGHHMVCWIVLCQLNTI